jgi:alanine-glyoxylate transaminase/serine-glyoxylate transaminase/serine-pyruvate transaminase
MPDKASRTTLSHVSLDFDPRGEASVEEVLMTPGPVSLSKAVRAAYAAPTSLHYGSDWVSEYNAVAAACRPLFGTRGDVLLIFGPGSASLEMALGSLLSRRDWIVVPTNGPFGDRLAEIATLIGLRVRRVNSSPLVSISAKQVEEAMEGLPVRAVAAVHHETMLGVVNPIEEISKIARQRGAFMIVDAVSSFGGINLDLDQWGIDVCVGVGNKCVGGPVGIAPVAVSDNAWERVMASQTNAAGWYLNLRTWRHWIDHEGSWHPHPTTMPVPVVRALGVALQEIHSAGLDAHRHRSLSAATKIRHQLEYLGFKCIITGAHASPVLTSMRVPKGIAADDFIDWLLKKAKIRIVGVRGDYAEGAVRVAHMGRAAEPESVDRFLRATIEYLACASV